MRNKLSIFFLSIIIFLIIIISGCGGGPELERTQPREKISLSGTFLTETPDEISFPMKVLFAIDCSLSMGDDEFGQRAGSDPDFLRFDAVREFIDEYNSNENTSFEIMLWNNDVFEYTRTVNNRGGFTKDTTEIDRVLNQQRNDTMTDYLGTLDAIYADIQRDINRMEDEEEQNLIRSKYIVVFLSDGMPNVQGTTQDNSDIWSRVNEIYEMVMDSGVGGFNFHTFLLTELFDSSEDGQLAQQYAEETLQGMADDGNGQFRLFDTAEAINFINIVDMRLTVEYKIKYMVAYNYNVRAGIELVYVDSDGDGLSDEEEREYETDPNNTDTDGDGMSDFFEIKASSPGHELDPTIQDSPCQLLADGTWPDSDNDGLTDCEEYVKGTNRNIADSDGDGIPDGIEFSMGTNPLEIQDTVDSDFDGSIDRLEVQQHTNVTSNDPKIRERYSYRYDIQDEGLISVAQGDEMPSYVRQYYFHISNIDIMDTEGHMINDDDYWDPGDNLIRLYIAEVPEDNPDCTPVFRMAEVLVNINNSNKEIILTPNDFSLIQ